MIITNTKFDTVKIFTPKVYYDDRGFFLESFNKTIFEITGATFIQDNHSKSKKYIIRGLHYQWNEPMGKLVRVIKGRGIDVIVDIRHESSTYGQYEKVELSEDNFNIVWVPPGFAHGFMSLEDDTHLVYKTSAYYNSQADGSINPLCSDLNINWGISENYIILSDKDKNSQSFSQYNQNPKF